MEEKRKKELKKELLGRYKLLQVLDEEGNEEYLKYTKAKTENERELRLMRMEIITAKSERTVDEAIGLENLLGIDNAKIFFGKERVKEGLKRWEHIKHEIV